MAIELKNFAAKVKLLVILNDLSILSWLLGENSILCWNINNIVLGLPLFLIKKAVIGKPVMINGSVLEVHSIYTSEV